MFRVFLTNHQTLCLDAQKQHIAELEARVERLTGGSGAAVQPGPTAVAEGEGEGGGDERLRALRAELENAESKCAAQWELLNEKDTALESMARSESAIAEEAERLRLRAEAAEVHIADTVFCRLLLQTMMICCRYEHHCWHC